MNFFEQLDGAMAQNESLLCVGLDVDLDMMGDRDLTRFIRNTIDATSDLVCAYKPNWAFYEALGLEGLGVLEQVRSWVPSHIPVIGDVKRHDLGNTSAMSARAMFDVWGFDAVTVGPYMGVDGLEPFLAYRDKGVFVLCRTSNPSAVEFQSLIVQGNNGAKPLYQVVAERCKAWNTYGNVGLVVGATYPEELREVRGICPDQVILIPGVGTQGGDMEQSIRNGVTSTGRGAIINVGRQIIYASRNENYAAAARNEAQRLRDAMNAVRSIGGSQDANSQ